MEDFSKDNLAEELEKARTELILARDKIYIIESLMQVPKPKGTEKSFEEIKKSVINLI